MNISVAALPFLSIDSVKLFGMGEVGAGWTLALRSTA